MLVFPVFAWLYFRRLPSGASTRDEAWRLGAFWCAVTIVVDLVGWVLIPHSWQMPARKFYIGYQPWLTLIYAVILLSPPAVERWAPLSRIGHGHSMEQVLDRSRPSR